jgi:protein gp37
MNRATSPTGWARNPDGSPGYTWNPLSGCLNHDNGLCKGGNFPCYAYKLANGRLRQRYLANSGGVAGVWNMGEDKLFETSTEPFYPRFWEERMNDIKRPPYPFSAWDGNACKTRPIEFLPQNIHAKRKAKGIFTCDMSDLFGIGIPEEWTEKVLDAIRINSVDRFYLLTKQPQNLIKWSPFPDNAWVGVTACNEDMETKALWELSKVQAPVKYISIEPFLERIPQYVGAIKNCGIDWIIIGACTGSAWDIGKVQRKYPELVHKPYGNAWTAQPRIEWVQELVDAADKSGVKVFLKDNLEPLWTFANRKEPFFKFSRVSPGATEVGKLRQEMPA